MWTQFGHSLVTTFLCQNQSVVCPLIKPIFSPLFVSVKSLNAETFRIALLRTRTSHRRLSVAWPLGQFNQARKTCRRDFRLGSNLPNPQRWTNTTKPRSSLRMLSRMTWTAGSWNPTLMLRTWRENVVANERGQCLSRFRCMKFFEIGTPRKSGWWTNSSKAKVSTPPFATGRGQT